MVYKGQTHVGQMTQLSQGLHPCKHKEVAQRRRLVGRVAVGY